jgi:Na+/melibiose symporter-like transporter
MMKNKRYWRIIATMAILLILITFTPLVIAPGKTDPKLFSMPYTLWMSILITVVLVVLTYVGGRVHLNDEDSETTNHK